MRVATVARFCCFLYVFHTLIASIWKKDPYKAATRTARTQTQLRRSTVQIMAAITSFTPHVPIDRILAHGWCTPLGGGNDSTPYSMRDKAE